MSRRRRRHHHVAALLTAVTLIAGIVVGACTAFAPSSASSSSSSGSASSSSGASSSGVLDATLTDNDGDGGSSGGGVDAAWCGTALLCDDFNDLKRDAGWTKTELAAPGTLEVNTNKSISGRSLEAKLADADFKMGIARRVYVIPGAWPRTRFSFDMFVENPNWTGGEAAEAVMSVAGIALDSQNNNGRLIAGLDLLFSKENLKINISVPPNGDLRLGEGLAPAPYDRWLSIQIEFEPNADKGKATLFVDTIPFKASEISWPKDPPKQARVYLGMDRYNAATPSFTAHYDNVKIETY